MDSDLENVNRSDYQPFRDNYSAQPDAAFDGFFDNVDEHLSLQQHSTQVQQPTEEIGTLHNHRNGRLCLTNCGPNESFEVVSHSDIPEEPVKSKPCGCHSGGHNSHASDTSTSDDDHSDTGKPVAIIGSQHLRAKSTRSSTISTCDGDVDTERECVTKRNPKEQQAATASSKQIRRTVTKAYAEDHSSLSKAVSRWFKRSKGSVIDLPMIKLSNCGVKVASIRFDCGGNSQRRYAMLTAVVHFPESSCICRKLLNFYECNMKLVVQVYRGRVEEGHKISEADTIQKLSCDERECRRMCMKVNEIVHLDEIVYPQVCLEIIGIQITVSLEANKIEVSAEDSAYEDFVDVRMSVEI